MRELLRLLILSGGAITFGELLGSVSTEQMAKRFPLFLHLRMTGWEKILP